MAQLALFACHLSDIKGDFSVDFDKMHGLSGLTEPLASAVMEDPESEDSRNAFCCLFDNILQYRGSLVDAPEEQYIVFNYLALRHLRMDGGFPPPNDVTQELAHLQWCFRLIAFVRLRRGLRESGGGVEEAGMIKKELECLHAGQATQMGMIHSLKGVLRMHAEQHPRVPAARWDDLRYTRLSCEGKQFSLEAFRAMNDRISSRAERLIEELMMGEEISTWFTIPDFIHDRDRSSGELYSFLVDARNKFDYLNSPFALDMLKHFAVSAVDGTIQSKNVTAYLSKCRALLDIIAAMMHLLSGGAPRAEEAIHTRILEGKEGRRNLFWMRGKIGWVLEYNKSKSQGVGRTKLVGIRKLSFKRVRPSHASCHKRYRASFSPIWHLYVRWKRCYAPSSTACRT